MPWRPSLAFLGTSGVAQLLVGGHLRNSSSLCIEPCAEISHNGAMVEHGHRGDSTFATTHWSVVLSAAGSPSVESADALEGLCRSYWYPLYAFVRRQGHPPEDARDLVQGFFLHLLRRDILQAARPARGRFRSFLLGALKHFLSDQRAKAEAQKRGGIYEVVSWDSAQAEAWFAEEGTDAGTPERLFDRRWALTILERARERLEAECVEQGKGQHLARLSAFVTGENGSLSYVDAAVSLSLSVSAVKSAIHRLRQRYYELIRGQVSQTVAEPWEVEDELRYMLALFSRDA